MFVVKYTMFLVVLILPGTFKRGDAEVCVLKESCILMCEFPPGEDAVIHWNQVKTVNVPVHSYYYNQDQLALQGRSFRGRTSLFKDQISRGNASLQLTGVEIQDQGRYQCYTSTTSGNKEYFIELNVEAPVRKVNIQQGENRITCSSEGIYPKPELTWSTNPPSNVAFNTTTTVQQTEQQLYNISSSLILSDSVTDLGYSCTVSTRRNSWRATLNQLPSIKVSGTETTISCSSSNTPLRDLIWSFNHSQIILTQTRTDITYRVSEGWRQQVKGVSKSGSLTLQALSSRQEGIYTCEVSNDEETYVTNTFLRMEESRGTAAIAVGVVAVIGVIIAAVSVALFCFRKKFCKKFEKTGTNNETDTGQRQAKTLLKAKDKESNGGKYKQESVPFNSITTYSDETKEMPSDSK